MTISTYTTYTSTYTTTITTYVTIASSTQVLQPMLSIPVNECTVLVRGHQPLPGAHGVHGLREVPGRESLQRLAVQELGLRERMHGRAVQVNPSLTPG